MQTIWTRALQVRSSCHCPFCAPTRQGLVRRLNVRPPRRKIQFGDYLTACYGTLLGTAAVVETKRKQDQRQALDGAIDNVKDEVVALCEDQEKRLKALGHAPEDDPKELAEKKIKRKDHHAETLHLIESLKTDGSGQIQQRMLALPALAPRICQVASTQQALFMNGDKSINLDELNEDFRWKSSDPLCQILPTTPDNAHSDLSLNTAEDRVPHMTGTSLENEDRPGRSRDGHDSKIADKVYTTSNDAYEARTDKEESLRLQRAMTDFEESSSNSIRAQYTSDAPIRKDILGKSFLSGEESEKRSPSCKSLEQGLDDSENSRELPSITIPSTDHVFKYPTRRFKSFSPEAHKYAFGSFDVFKGRSSEEVWNSEETPFVNSRNRMQREAAIARLVYKLALSYFDTPEVKQGQWPHAISLDVSGEQILDLSYVNRPELHEKVEDLSHRLRVLQGLRKRLPTLVSIQDLSFPSYQSFGEDERQAEASHIAAQNDALLNIFLTSHDPNTLFSRLCSALLSQSFAPNIHTFNLLIIRLCHAQFFSAAMLVIEALHASSVNHNEVTYSAILDCFISLSQFKRFQGYLNRMEGVAGSGVRTTFNRQQVVESLQPELYFLQPRNLPLLDEHNPALIDEVYGEKAKKNTEVYEAVIVGCLRVGNPENAVSYYYSMLSSGFPPTRTILQELLEYSVRVSDWHVGLSIWEHMKARFHPLPLLSYYWMLQLCVECQLPARFELVLQDGLHHDIISSRLLYDDFVLDEGLRHRIFSRAHEIRKLRQTVWMPGLPRSSFLDDMDDLPQSPNLYSTQLTEYISLVEAKHKELGWLIDSKRSVQLAVDELLQLRRGGRLSEKRMLSKALWLSNSLKAQQCYRPQINELSLLEAKPKRKVLPTIPSPRIKHTARDKKALTVDLSKPADEDTLDALRSYLSKGRNFKEPRASRLEAAKFSPVRRPFQQYAFGDPTGSTREAPNLHELSMTLRWVGI